MNKVEPPKFQKCDTIVELNNEFAIETIKINQDNQTDK